MDWLSLFTRNPDKRVNFVSRYNTNVAMAHGSPIQRIHVIGRRFAKLAAAQ
jgi:hypothetical protein